MKRCRMLAAVLHELPMVQAEIMCAEWRKERAARMAAYLTWPDKPEDSK